MESTTTQGPQEPQEPRGPQEPTGVAAVLTFLAAASGMCVITAAALLFVLLAPPIVLGGTSVATDESLVAASWLSLLLTVGVAVLGIKLCNRAKSRLVRIALFVGYGLAVVPLGVFNLLWAGMCITSGGVGVYP